MSASKFALPLTAIVLTATAFAAPVGSGADTPNPAARPVTAGTPDDCIRRNGGDYNACNVAGQAQGGRTHSRTQPRTPDECIRTNGGDWNACNVGNQGRGDLPYLPVG
jgi:hypothetical protein